MTPAPTRVHGAPTGDTAPSGPPIGWSLRRHRSWDILRATRPWLWPVAWLPAWFGASVATRSWFPLMDQPWRTVAALVVLGPLVWRAVSLLNDVFDLDTDRRNPRKASSPLVSGQLGIDTARRWAMLLCGAAVAVSAFVGPLFTLGTLLVLLLGWAYSARPVRLKGRPGWDVAANAVTVGVAGPLAGWFLHRPASQYPAALAVLGVTLAASLYLATTALDGPYDHQAGVVTFAVRWGRRRTYAMGVALWAAATATWLTCVQLGVIGPGGVSRWQLAACGLPLAAYTVLTWRPTIPRMAVVVVLFAVPATQFLSHLVLESGGA